MRSANYNSQVLEKMQGELFAIYMRYEICSPIIFVRRFMYSDLAKRFDDQTVLLESSSIENMVDEIDDQYGVSNYGKIDRINTEALYWLGALLRHWCFTYEIRSKILIANVDIKKLLSRYPLYHSMDFDYAIKRIIEEDKIKIEKKDILDILKELEK